MSRKLPKAIGRTIDDLRRDAADPEAVKAAPAKRAQIAAKARHPGAFTNPTNERDAGTLHAVAGEAAVSALPAGREIAPAPAAVATRADRDFALRHSRGREIVERHATYSVIGGIIPLPILDIVSVTAIIVHMVKRLAEHYEVPFERDRTRAIVIGLMGGVAPTGLGALAAAALMRVTPGANLVGFAVSSMVAAACTRRIGWVFLEHFESGGTLLDLRVSQG